MEYEAVLAARLPELDLTKEQLAGFLGHFVSLAERIKVFYLWHPDLRDPSDDMILETALSLNHIYVTLFLSKLWSYIMPRSATKMLDLSVLPAPERREIRDFFQFLLTRRSSTNKSESSYKFIDLCGTLSWRGDAVATQQSLRDEW